MFFIGFNFCEKNSLSNEVNFVGFDLVDFPLGTRFSIEYSIEIV